MMLDSENGNMLLNTQSNELQGKTYHCFTAIASKGFEVRLSSIQLLIPLNLSHLFTFIIFIYLFTFLFTLCNPLCFLDFEGGNYENVLTSLGNLK